MPRRVKVAALARGRDADFLAHQPAAGIQDEELELGVRADLGVELRRDGSSSAGCSWTMIQRTSAPSPSVRWLTDVTSASPVPVCRSTMVALAPAPTRTGRRVCAWPPAWRFWISIGVSTIGAGGDVEEAAIGARKRC